LRLQVIPVRIVRRDRRAAVGGAVAVAAPEGGDEREAVDAAACRQRIADRRDDELRLPAASIRSVRYITIEDSP
jgi:hypothetical protein